MPTPGLIDQIPPIPTPTPPPPVTTVNGVAQQAEAASAVSQGYTPAGFDVAPNQTVQRQVLDIVGQDSPLMQQARTKANQLMNARGLLNSSLNTQAGQEAVIGAALPIAQQDASTYNKAMTDTQNAKNAALQFGAAAGNTASLANAQLTTDVSKSNAQLGTQTNLTNAEAANKALELAYQTTANYGLAGLDANLKVSLANLDTNTKITLTTMDNQYKQLMQLNTNAANMFNQVATNLAAIARDTTMSKTAKDAATQTQLDFLQQGLAQQQAVAKTEADAITSLNIPSLFDGTITSGGTGNVGTATPIPGTNPVTSEWSDGQKHTKPASGSTIKVVGIGPNGSDVWWGSDGKFYATQADAITLKNPLGTTVAPPVTGTPGGGFTTPPPTGPPVPGRVWTGTGAPPANQQWVSPYPGVTGGNWDNRNGPQPPNTPGVAGYRVLDGKWVWVNANGQM